MSGFPDFQAEHTFRLRIHTQLNNVEVAVNGVLVFANQTGRQVTTEWPLNEWLHRGENTISALISKPLLTSPDDQSDIEPNWVPDSMIGVSLCSIAPDDTARSTSHGGFLWRFRDAVLYAKKWVQTGVTSNLEAFEEEYFARAGTINGWPGDIASATEIMSDPEKIQITWKFNMRDDWPVCDWQNAIEMEDSPGYRHSANVLYKSIHEAIASGNLMQLRSLMEFRTAAYRRAYHMNERSVDQALRIIPAMASGEWEMLPLDLSSGQLFLHPNRKIAELRTSLDRRGLLQFTTANGMSGAIEVALSCIGGKWIWIR